jgi:type IV pilus assembly protein PilM
MPVSLVLSNQNIKLVSVRKNTVERWATEPLPAGLVKDGRILDSKALAKALEAVFVRLRLPRSEVFVSVTGISYIYRILQLPRLKPEQQKEAIERATRKELKVPLDELYIDWQIFANTGQEIGVFVAGIPRILVDDLIMTLKLAGINPIKMEINVLALARAANQAEALLVDFGPDWFDIAIVARGIPVTLHGAAPKSQIASLEDNIGQLKDELNRTIDFFNLTHKDNPISATAPVILTGSLADDPAVAGPITETIGRPLQTLESSFKKPADFPLAVYAGNLGMVLKNGNYRRQTKPGVENYLNIDIDPLKARRKNRARPPAPRAVLIGVLVIVAILLVIITSVLRNQAVAETTRLQTESDRLDRSLRMSRLALDEAAATETAISDLTAATKTLIEEQQLISGRGTYSTLLAIVTGSLPPEAEISTISITVPEVVLEGNTIQRADIIDLADSLTRSGEFSEVRIALIEQKPADPATGQGSAYSFQIVIQR